MRNRARVSAIGQPKITFLNGDVLTQSFQPDSFDFVVAVATLHHLPLREALERFRDLLRPGGVLVIVGLYRIATPVDYLYAATALPISWAIRRLREADEVGAPLREPLEALKTIRDECTAVLPGSVLRRRFFFATPLCGTSPEGEPRFHSAPMQRTHVG